MQERLELAFRCAPIGVAVLRPDGRLVETNPALRAMLGYSAEELAELTFEQISHPEDQLGAAAIVEALLAGELETNDTVRRYLRRDGTVMFARRVLAMGEDTEGRGRYILLQMEDVTGERLARAELRERQLRDSLTGVATWDSLAYELAVSSTPRSLVVVELRDLSRLNGVLGPSYGDQVLIQAAQRIKLCCRDVDLVVRLDGSEFAVVVRGQVFVASTEFGDTRRITDGPGQKRSVSFSPEGRKLVYACEQDGHWALCEAAIAGDKKTVPHFFNAPRVTTRVLLEVTKDAGR